MCCVSPLSIRLPSEDAEQDLRHIACFHELNHVSALTVINSGLPGELHELIEWLRIVPVRVELVQQLARQLDGVEEILKHHNALVGALLLNVLLILGVITALQVSVPDPVEDELYFFN